MSHATVNVSSRDVELESNMNRVSLSEQEVGAIKGLVGEAVAQYTSVEDERFLKDACLIAHELPRRIRRFLNDFKYLEPLAGACVVSAYPIDEEKIGLTPGHWKSRRAVSPTLEEEILFVLFGSLLGDVMGWATQQNGYIVHDVLPIKEYEDSQISSGSLQTIWWHNEDAFHPYRGDFVALMCLRNPDQVPTTLACIDGMKLDERVKSILSEPRFIIRPDDSHIKSKTIAAATKPGLEEGLLEASCQHIEEMNAHPTRVPILYGNQDAPYVRIDPYYMDSQGDPEAQFALDALRREIDARLTEIVLSPGDFIFIDNYRAVHGRKSFHARYDGTDRWLKRINITKDLRKSSDARATRASRIVL
jgi:Fe(II)/alpha-ketoglutarate-dependent arginine beta-hydroxylase